jgi:peroxiredoxin
MLEAGERAPAFEAPMATPENAENGTGEFTAEEVERFALAAVDGPVVLAFYPGAFSRTCTRELCQLRDWWDDLAGLEAAVYGVSVDPPFPLLAFVDRYDLSFPQLSGFNNDVIEAFGVRQEEGLLRGIARRSVFVLDDDRRVRYAWRADEPLTFPDLDEVEDAIATAT